MMIMRVTTNALVISAVTVMLLFLVFSMAAESYQQSSLLRRALAILCPQGELERDGNRYFCVMEPEPICRNGGQSAEEISDNSDFGNQCVTKEPRGSDGSCPDGTIGIHEGDCLIGTGEFAKPRCTEKGFKLNGDGECAKKLKPSDIRNAINAGR